MTWRAARRPPPVITADPVGQPRWRSDSSRIRSGPAARCIAPSTPPPPASEAFAALISASTFRVVMSARRSTMLPPATARVRGSGSIRTGEGEAHVVSAKPERRAEREVNTGGAAVVGHVIQIALGTGLIEGDRRRHELVANGHDRDDRLHG